MNAASAFRSTGTDVGLAGYAKYRARAPVRSRTRPTNDTPTMPGSAPAVLVMPRSAPAYLQHGQPHQAHHLCFSSHMTPGKAIRLPVAGDSKHNIWCAWGAAAHLGLMSCVTQHTARSQQLSLLLWQIAVVNITCGQHAVAQPQCPAPGAHNKDRPLQNCPWQRRLQSTDTRLTLHECSNCC